MNHLQRIYIFLSFVMLSISTLAGASEVVTIDLRGKGILITPQEEETHWQSPALIPMTIHWSNNSQVMSHTALRQFLASSLGDHYVDYISVPSGGLETNFHIGINAGDSESLQIEFLCNASVHKTVYVERPKDYLSRDKNWVRTRTYTGTGQDDYYHDVIYYDALGLPSQSVSVGASPSGKSVITAIWKDSLFRTDTRHYLPYEASYSTGKRDETPYAAARYAMLYGSEDKQYPYGETLYDNYASGRTVSEMTAGKAFRDSDKKTVYDYDLNSSEDGVLRLGLSSDMKQLVVGAPFISGSLTKTTTLSPDGRKREVFQDKLGKTILERNYITITPKECADTYFVYDSRGNLAWVLSPEGSSRVVVGGGPYTESGFASKWATVYRYDGRGRMIAKRNPGAGWEYTIYDNGGRAVLQQDSVQRASNRWTFFIYDNIGREINRTEVTSTVSRVSIQSYYDDVNFNNSYPALGGSSDWRIPISSTVFSNPKELLTVRYGCDHYRTGTSSSSTAKFTVPSHLAFSPVQGIVFSWDRDTTTRGMKIYEKIAILGSRVTTMQGNGYVERAFYYDSKGRVIQTVERNALGGISRTSIRYDFQGHPLIIQEKHRTSSSDSTDDIKITEYSYDNRGRLLSVTTTVNDGTPATVSYSYDAVGRLVQQDHGNSLSERRSYTAAGWLTEQITTANSASDTVFRQRLDYWNPVSGTGLYGGDISGVQWTQESSSSINYQFSYDLLGRLNSADRPGTQSLAETGITYDRNGNLLTLMRYSASGSLQNDFIYGYGTDGGNQLKTLTNGNASYSYTYNGNGVMTQDTRLNLAIVTNSLNLPDRVLSLSNTTTEKAIYLYLADGTLVFTGTPTPAGYGGYTRLGSLEYSGIPYQGSQTLISTEFAGGRIHGATGEDIRYYTRDHLGSVRVITGGSGTIQARNDYYPFGERIATSDPGMMNRWRFSGKEEQTLGNLGWLDFGARMYDPCLGRWTAQDPLAGKYPSLSPYSYCADNPMNLVDPYGESIWDFLKGFWIGFCSNIIPGPSSRRDVNNIESREDYNRGLKLADVISTVLAGGMIVGGQSGAAAGSAMIVGGGSMALSIAGAPEGAALAGTGVVVVSGSELLEAGGAALAASTALNASSGYQHGNEISSNHKSKSTNQLQKDVEKGSAPKGIRRFDKAHSKKGQDHVHFKDGTSINKDGTIHDAYSGSHKWKKEEIEYLIRNGWLINEEL